jgi:hypothetical protein
VHYIPGIHVEFKQRMGSTELERLRGGGGRKIGYRFPGREERVLSPVLRELSNASTYLGVEPS